MSGTNSRVVLTTGTAGNEYFDMLLVFLISLRIAGEYDGKVLVDLINGGPKDLAAIDKAYPGAAVNNIVVPQISMLSTMYTRPKQIMTALNAGYNQVAAIDADIIVRKPIEGMWDDVHHNTVKVWDKLAVPPIFPDAKTRKYWMAVKVPKLHHKDRRANIQGGVQIYGNGDKVRAFYKEFMRRLGEEFKFWDGQVVLYNMLRKRYAGVKYVNLGPMYNDSFFCDETVMWHVKHKHFGEKKWKAETKKWTSLLSAS